MPSRAGDKAEAAIGMGRTMVGDRGATAERTALATPAAPAKAPAAPRGLPATVGMGGKVGAVLARAASSAGEAGALAPPEPQCQGPPAPVPEEEDEEDPGRESTAA